MSKSILQLADDLRQAQLRATKTKKGSKRSTINVRPDTFEAPYRGLLDYQTGTVLSSRSEYKRVLKRNGLVQLS